MPFKHEAYQSPYTGSIAQIIGEQAEIRARAAQMAGLAQARAAEVAGQGRANTIGAITQGIGQSIGNLGQILQQRRDAPAIAQERELELRARQAQIAQIEDNLRKSRASEQEARMAKSAMQEAMKMSTTEDGSVDYKRVAESLLRQGWRELPKLVMDQAAPKAPDLHNVPAGTAVLDANNPKAGPVFTTPEKAPTTSAPSVGSFEDYVLRQYGPNPTAAQITEGRKVYQQADDRPITVNTGRQSSGLTPNMESQVINRLTNQWTNTTKPARELEKQVGIMEEGIKAARAGNLNAGGQAVLVTFQKILDPNSVVRESEFDRSREGQSLMQRARGIMERLTQGGPGVPLPELEKYAEVAKQIATAQRNSRLDAIKERIGRTADRYNIPRDLVFEAEPGPVSATTIELPAAGAPGGAPKEGDVKPIPGYPGTEQTYRNGKWIRTK